MLKLFRYLIYGHDHKWEIIREVKLHNNKGEFQCMDYTLQCKCCGELKFKKSIMY